MSDLDLQLKEVRNQSDRHPAEVGPGGSKKLSNPRRFYYRLLRWPSFFLFFVVFNYMFKGRIETNENRRRAGELVTLLDEPYLAFLFNYLSSPPSSPAVGAMSVVVTVAYIADVVELSLACLCSQLCFFFLTTPTGAN
jgi:hypothetical protein